MRPRLLALDSSTDRAALALCSPMGLRGATTDPAARHGRSLLPAIRDLLAASGLRPSDLDGFAVGLGPGSYTGLRVGVMAIKTLAYATAKGLVGLDSLEVIARNAPPEALRVSVVAAGQRGDLFAADFLRDAPGGPLLRAGPTRVVPFDDWATQLPRGTLVLGPALASQRFAARMPTVALLPDDPAANAPAPSGLAELAVEAWNAGNRVDPWVVEPVYLRRAAAEDQWAKAGR